MLLSFTSSSSAASTSTFRLPICFGGLHTHTHSHTDAAYLNATKLYTVFTRETVLAMKSILSNAYIYTIGAVPELYVTNATLEAFDVIEQSQAFDGHGRTLTCGNGG